ncbi:MAG: DUF2304 domain-containing protein, partial [Solirubrobacteraceae bacterium]|nr:DUF2304 domain-containing protein [Patulibacter sp.]
MIGQTLIIMAGALLLMGSTVLLVRRRLLSIRYGIGWLTVGTLGLIGTPLLTYVSNRLDIFGFTPTGFSLGVFILFLGLVCLQLSISLSGLHRAIQDITEHAAHLDARLRRLEGDTAPRGALGAPAEPRDRRKAPPTPRDPERRTD